MERLHRTAQPPQAASLFLFGSCYFVRNFFRRAMCAFRLAKLVEGILLPVLCDNALRISQLEDFHNRRKVGFCQIHLTQQQFFLFFFLAAFCPIKSTLTPFRADLSRRCVNPARREEGKRAGRRRSATRRFWRGRTGNRLGTFHRSAPERQGERRAVCRR